MAKKWVCFSLLFLMLLCFGQSLGYLNQITSAENIRTIYLGEMKKTVSDIKQMQATEKGKSEALTFSAWVQKNNQDLYNPAFYRHASADVIIVCGDSSLVLLSPIALGAADADGCLISEDIAYTLFGNSAPENNKLMLGNRTLTVRGILPGKNTMIVQAVSCSVAQQISFSAISIDTSGVNPEKIESMFNQFSERYGLPQESYNNGVYRSWTTFFCFIFPFFSVLIVIASFLNLGMRFRNKPFLCLTCIVASIASFVIALYLYQIHISISPSMMPSRFSDFEFWGDLYKNDMKDLGHLFRMTKQRPEVSMIAPMLKSIGFSLAATGLFLVVKRLIKIGSAMELCIILGVNLIFEYMILLYLHTIGLDVEKLMMFWLLFPCYLVGVYVVKYLLDLATPHEK